MLKKPCDACRGVFLWLKSSDDVALGGFKLSISCRLQGCAEITEDKTLDDRDYMALALAAATSAGAEGEVPVGAVLVAESGEVVAVAGNAQMSSCDPTAHAEVLALRAAGQKLSNYRLPGCTLYVTLEPCTMCCGALIHARVKRLVFAAREPKAGAVVSTSSTLSNAALNHHVEWSEGVAAEASASLLRQFFSDRRSGRISKPVG